jgi:hypothetical protein
MLNDGPGVGHPVSPPGVSTVETPGPPKFLGNPNIHLHMVFDPGRKARSSPERNGHAVPAYRTTKTPTIIFLSRLNSMAFGLAVYASSRWLPRHDARLASGCRLRSAGWPWGRWVPMKGFNSCWHDISPLPKLAWRNLSKINFILIPKTLDHPFDILNQRRKISIGPEFDPFILHKPPENLNQVQFWGIFGKVENR